MPLDLRRVAWGGVRWVKAMHEENITGENVWREEKAERGEG